MRPVAQEASGESGRPHPPVLVAVESPRMPDAIIPNSSFLWRNSSTLPAESYYEMGPGGRNTYDTIRSADYNRSSSSSNGYDEIQSPEGDRKTSAYTYDELSFQRRPSDGYILPGQPESLSSSALGYERILPPEEKPELGYEPCGTGSLPPTSSLAMLYDDIQGYSGYSGSNSYEPIYADLHTGSRRMSTLPAVHLVKELDDADPELSSSKCLHFHFLFDIFVFILIDINIYVNQLCLDSRLKKSHRVGYLELYQL